MKVFPESVGGRPLTSPRDGFDQRGSAQRLGGEGSPKLLSFLVDPGSGTQSSLLALTVLPQLSSADRPRRGALSLPGQELSQHLVQKQGKTLPDF